MKRILAMSVAAPLLVTTAGCATRQDTGVLAGGVLGGAVDDFLAAGASRARDRLTQL